MMAWHMYHITMTVWKILKQRHVVSHVYTNNEEKHFIGSLEYSIIFQETPQSLIQDKEQQ